MLFWCQLADACFSGELDVHAQAIGIAPGFFDEQRVGVRNRLEVNVAAKQVDFAQLAGDAGKLFHGVVGRLDDAGAEEEAIDIIAAVKIHHQADYFLRLEAGAGHIAGAPVDAVLAIVDAEVCEQNLEQGHASAIRREAVADAHAGGGSQAFLALGRAIGCRAAGAGDIVFRRIGKDGEFVGDFHIKTVVIYTV